jgi:hypothetical protein
MTYGGDVSANELLAALLAGEDVSIPDIDFSGPEFQIPGGTDSEMYQPIIKVTNEDLTTREVNGAGTFDALMSGFAAHLKIEYEKGRISGGEYTKAFIQLTQGAMSNAVQFLLGRDASYWQAVQAQAQAITARVQLETAKVQYASLHLEALVNKANFALTKLKLATEDVTYAAGQFNIDSMLPQQLLMVTEQTEAQRAQTSDTRTDGGSVAGVLGKQKDLYTQQITSYQRNDEIKAAKLFTDAWITQKTIDEGLLPPPNFENASVDEILGKIKSNNDLEV